MSKIVGWIAQLCGFHVVVIWEGKVVHHYTLSYEDAIDWMAQYPLNSVRACVWLRNQLITARG